MNRFLGIFRKGNLGDIPQSPLSPSSKSNPPLHLDIVDHDGSYNEASDKTAIDARNLKDLDFYFQKVVETIKVETDSLAVVSRSLKRKDGLSVETSKTNAQTKAAATKRVDASAMQPLLCPELISEKLFEKIFNVYATDSSNTVEVRQFFAGLSACCGGTTDDKLVYCFTLYDEDQDGRLTKSELHLMLETLYKLGDIHTKLMKSFSTLLTFSRTKAPNPDTFSMTSRSEKDPMRSYPSVQVSNHNIRGSGSVNGGPAEDDPNASMRAIPPSVFVTSLSKLPDTVSHQTLSSIKSGGYQSSTKGVVPGFENVNKALKTYDEERYEKILHSPFTSPRTGLSVDSLNDSASKSNTELSDDGRGSLDILNSTTNVIVPKRNRSGPSQPVSSAEQLVNVLYSSLDRDELELIALNEYLRWVHMNPRAMQFLDKVKYIASISKNKETHLADEEKEIVSAHMENFHPDPGDECFILSAKWWRLWLDYGKDLTDGSRSSGDSLATEFNEAPGQIDNNDLLIDDEIADIADFPLLRDSLLDGVDYVVISREMWNCLHSWYGGGPAIVRHVTEAGVSTRRQSILGSLTRSTGMQLRRPTVIQVDLYPLLLGIGFVKDRKVISRCVCSSEIFAQELKQLVCHQLNLPYSASLKIWITYLNKEVTLVEEMGISLRELGITSGYAVFIDAKSKHERSSSVAMITNWFARNTVAPSSPVSAPSIPAAATVSPTGIVGLSNLGNTCFLNAALQALLRTPQIVSYFLDDMYLSEINERESDGQITLEFAKLVKQVWKTKSFSSIAPQNLRMALIRRSPQFGGHEQHDSQEVLGLLLDFLHMDLNLVEKKLSKENPDFSGQLDTELADIYWANHISRDASVIVSLFEGQFKTHCVCMTCKHEIVKFHPFMFLSLPLPENYTRVLSFVFVPAQGPCVSFKLRIDKNSLLADIIPIFKSALQIPDGSSSFLMADVQGHYIFSFFRKNRLVSDIRDRDSIAIYEIVSHKAQDDTISEQIQEETAVASEEQEEEDSTRRVRITLLHRQFKEDWTITGKRTKSFLYGIPLVLYVEYNETDGITGKQVYDLVAKKLTANFAYASLVQELQGVSLTRSFTKSTTPVSPINPRLPPSLSQPDKTSAFPFVLKLVANNGTVCSRCTDIHSAQLACTGCVLEAGPEIVRLDDNETLSIEWNAKVRKAGVSFISTFSAVTEHPSYHELSTNAENAGSLEDVISAYEKVEWMNENDYYCPKCKGNQPGLKRETIWKFPPILMIQLKRFSYTAHGCFKNDMSVVLPLQNFDATQFKTPYSEGTRKDLLALIPQIKSDNTHRPFAPETKAPSEDVYDLYAVINHLGSFYDGHYISLAKDQTRDKWFVYNDDECREWTPSGDRIASNQAYVLFYQKRNIARLRSMQELLRHELEKLSISTLEKKEADLS